MSKPTPGKPVLVDHGGDELTRLQSKRYVPREGIRLFLESHRAGEFAKQLQKLKLQCDRTLVEHKLPPSGIEIVEHDAEGNWRYQNTTADALSEQYSGSATASTFAIAIAQPFTNEWYAAKLGSLAVDVLAAIRASQINQSTFYDLVQIGHLTRDREWRFKYRKPIISGIKSSKGGKQGAEMRRKRREAKTKAVLQNMDAFLTEHRKQRSVKEAARAAMRKVSQTTEAGNLRLWYRYKKKT